MLEPLVAADLPAGIRARFVPEVNGLTMHVLEAGSDTPDRPCVLLLHGFPEIAYSWRKVMGPLAAAGFYVVAPDQRGYGRTTGWDGAYAGDLAQYNLLNLATDAFALLRALGRDHVAGIVGHDFGAPVAAACALTRPDVFRSVALMSGPFAGTPEPPFGAPPPTAIHTALAALDRPRKHYQWYYSTREADPDMRDCPQGVHDFLRAYFHVKSADWDGNRPHKLRSWTAGELAQMPTYYIMDRDRTMPETVAPYMPTAEQVARCGWLSDRELAVYSGEYVRNGFAGGLQWYRRRTDGTHRNELALFSGRAIEVPAIFVAGRSDWGVYQTPGALERMREQGCARLIGCHLVDGAGHWVQQEQPDQVTELLLRLLRA